MWRVGTPRLNPAGGTYFSAQSVTLTTATASATIHYTTNGSEPTETDPSVAPGATVNITQTATLKAKAYLAGSPASGA